MLATAVTGTMSGQGDLADISRLSCVLTSVLGVGSSDDCDRGDVTRDNKTTSNKHTVCHLMMTSDRHYFYNRECLTISKTHKYADKLTSAYIIQ